MNSKILFVDDEPNVLEGYKRQLHKLFTIETAVGAQEALARISKNDPYSVVVADMRMPQMNGVEFLSKVCAISPDTIRIMLTGNADQETAMRAVNEGHIFRFLTKPCQPETLVMALKAGLEQYRLITAEAELLEKTLIGSINILTDMLYMAEPRIFGQARKLRDLVQEVINAVDYPNKWELELAALLSRIGHLTVPHDVVLKETAGLHLTEQEKSILANIPEVSCHLLGKIPRLEPIAQIIRYQGKNYNGSGFPPGDLAGENIPRGSRILKILSDLLEMEAQGTPRSVALRLMHNKPSFYDLEILDTITNHLIPPLKVLVPRSTSGRTMRSLKPEEAAEVIATQKGGSYTLAINFEDLLIGDILVADICATDGSLLLSAGNRITDTVMETLKNYARLRGIVEPIHVAISDQ